jgi:hypothetical protein
MKVFAIIIAVIFFAAAACYEFGVVMTFHPKRAAICAGLGVLALIWVYYQKASATRSATKR